MLLFVVLLIGGGGGGGGGRGSDCGNNVAAHDDDNNEGQINIVHHHHPYFLSSPALHYVSFLFLWFISDISSISGLLYVGGVFTNIGIGKKGDNLAQCNLTTSSWNFLSSDLTWQGAVYTLVISTISSSMDLASNPTELNGLFLLFCCCNIYIYICILRQSSHYH